MYALLLLSLTLSAAPDRLAAKAPRPGGIEQPAAARTSAELEEELRGLLGAIDTPIAAERWKALGAAARPALEALMLDEAQLPSRRAKAVDALAVLTQAPDAPLFLGVALDPRAPFVVRLSAVRAVGAIVPAAAVEKTLAPVLDRAEDSRVRAAASQVVAARAPEACASLAERLGREAPAVRAQFAPVAQRCGWADAVWR